MGARNMAFQFFQRIAPLIIYKGNKNHAELNTPAMSSKNLDLG